MDQNADVIKGIGEDIFQHPELGYKETRTAGIVAKALSSLDLPVTEGLGITGVSIIAKGGDLVNVIPADVRVETYVRGATMESILDANAKVNRAFRAGADALGAEIEIEEIPGYLPRRNYPALDKMMNTSPCGSGLRPASSKV